MLAAAGGPTLCGVQVEELKLDANGLITVVAQDHRTGEVRMVAHADRTALGATLDTGFAHFFSRSRSRLWKKGEASGNVLAVHEVWLDCDRDAAIYLVEPSGPTCHTGTVSCFTTRLWPDDGEAPRALPALEALEAVIEARRSASADKSYTRSLLEKGPKKLREKLLEEAGELADAVADEPAERVVSEAADLVYHAAVALRSRGVTWAAVQAELLRRFGTSGHVEKASR